MLTNEELTKIYHDANQIQDGKSPPISTVYIMTAMREAYQLGVKSVTCWSLIRRMLNV